MTKGARTLRRAISVLFCAAAAVVGVLAIPVQAQAASPFTRAFTDDIWFDSIGASWVPRTVSTGAKIVLLEIDWASVESNAPVAGEDPTSPSDPNLAFYYIDDVLRKFAGSGIQAAFLVTDAPAWAEAPGGPANFESEGAWKPNATALGHFAQALARRYSGSYPDPKQPGVRLPRVRYYQAWGEPNLNLHLSPQWQRSGGKLVPAAPAIYRGMLNAFYAGVKAAHGDNVVLTAGFAPYGDAPGGARIPPAAFLRSMLCLNGRTTLSPAPCPNPAHFDALAMNPYEVAAPTTHAVNADDVSAPDLGKLRKIVNKAVSVGRAFPRANKQLWVTEFSYESSPPNSSAVSAATQARWLEESFYVFWSEGVSVDVWYLLRDQIGDYATTAYASGVYFTNGRAKPSYEAYRFPFVIMPAGRGATAWGISPRTGRVSVQHKVGRSWRTLFTVRVGAGSVFTRGVSPGLRGSFRATVGGETSLTWTR